MEPGGVRWYVTGQDIREPGWNRVDPDGVGWDRVEPGWGERNGAGARTVRSTPTSINHSRRSNGAHDYGSVHGGRNGRRYRSGHRLLSQWW